MLSLPRRSLAARYTAILLTFFISGNIHVLLDWKNGIALADTTAHRLFLMQTVGIMAEDGAEWAFHRWKKGRAQSGVEVKTEGKGGVEKAARWQRVLGYVWVVAFLAWTTPSWSYANFRHNGDRLVPFSLVETVQAMRA